MQAIVDINIGPKNPNPNAPKYFPPPPIIPSYIKYQDVNANKELQHDVTSYFLNCLIDWISYDKDFKRFKSDLSFFRSEKGYDFMHKLLRIFVRKGNTNWYDLRLQEPLVKDYIKHKLNSIS